MNVSYRGILYTRRTEADVLLFCAPVKQLERLAAGRVAAWQSAKTWP